ncbi:MAG: hypothetical protein OXN96_21605 [Bryobacterales bacterium]|nr:hypothetical protein [Bryobacterales bacterium]MDE0622029.1 hypothetical protein [Bryobacterales bacterium]
MDLKRQLGVSYNSAWMIKHKLMQAMREREDSQPLRGIVELDDAYRDQRGQAGTRGGPQDALSGRGTGQRGGASRTAAPEPGERLPATGGGNMGAPAVAPEDGGAFGRAAVFPGRAGGRLRAPAAARLRRRAHSAAALSAPNFGWNCWVIRYMNVSLQHFISCVSPE